MSTPTPQPITLPELPSIAGNAAIAQTVQGEIDAQVATARRFPRDIKQFMTEVQTLAGITPDVAASCFYRLKRKDKDGTTKTIEGPSIRFAELIAGSWRNLRVQSRITHEDASFVYAAGTCLDVERNVGIQMETRRRITSKEGRRFGDDMIAVTANAASAIALRNAIFRVVPKALWEPLLEDTIKIAIGDSKSFADRKQKALALFQGKYGLTPDQIAKYLEIPNLEAMTVEHIGDLKGLATALRDGETTIDKEFPPDTPNPPDAATSPITDALAQMTSQIQKPAAPAAPPTDPTPTDDTPIPAAGAPAGFDPKTAFAAGKTKK